MKLKPLALTALASLALVSATACSKGGDQSSNTTTTTTTSTHASPAAAPAAAASSVAGAVQNAENAGAAAVAGGDAAHGKQLFTSQPCSSCHGATGTEGGVGPSLKNEKSRKNFAQVVAQIKNPAPPMPKLYPSPLSDKDVNDLAAFVETL